MAELEKIKAKVSERLERLWHWLEEDGKGVSRDSCSTACDSLRRMDCAARD